MGTLVRLKRFLSRDENGETYECVACHASFEYQQQVCSECGGYDIRSTEWLDEQADSTPEEGT